MKKFCILLALSIAITQTCFSFEIPLYNKRVAAVSLALDESGNITAALLTEKNKKYFIEVTTSRDAGCTWEPPTTLSSHCFIYTKPVLALDSNSEQAIVVWEEEGSELMISRSQNSGQSWSKKKLISIKTEGARIPTPNPITILLSSGHVLICREVIGKIDLINSNDFGQSWSSTTFRIEDLAKLAGNSNYKSSSLTHKPKVQLLENGTGLVVMRLNDDKTPIIALSTADFGETWKLVPPPPAHKTHYSLHLNMSAEGKIICTWMMNEGIYFSYSEGNNEWTSPELFTGTENSFPMPKIALAPNGKGFFVFENSNDDDDDESHFIRTTENHGKTWKESGKLNVLGSQGHFLTAISANGDCSLVWNHFIGRKSVIQTAYSFNYGHEWSEVSTISKSFPTMSPLKLLMNSQGQAIVLWFKEHNNKGSLCGAYSDDFGKTWQQ